MRIIIYTRNNCVQCDQGFRQLPVVVAGETSWSGFRPDMINRLHPEHRVASA